MSYTLAMVERRSVVVDVSRPIVVTRTTGIGAELPMPRG